MNIQTEKINNKTQMIGWRCPSNIALVKYWGKYGVQLPENPSISFSLQKSYTETRIEYKKAEQSGISFQFYLDNQHKKDFEPKLQLFFERIIDIFPFLNNYHLDIYSTNSFPHSAGIASSASAMGALALCICSIDDALNNKKTEEKAFFQKASNIARLGSGSAARSIYGGFTLWGKTDVLSKSSQEYAIDINSQINPEFQNLHDAILLVSSEKKKISSRQGHSLMNNHPYAASRYLDAKKNIASLLKILNHGDEMAFADIVEFEAFNLHALMMSSMPAFTLLHGNSLEIIEHIRKFREETKIPLTFTIDAGPNIHLLYAEKYREQVLELIQTKLILHCQNKNWIDDKMGVGPIKI